MPRLPRQRTFAGPTNKQVEAVATSEEEESTPDASDNISMKSIGEHTEEEEGAPAVEEPEEEEEESLEDTFEEEPNMAEEPEVLGL